VDGRDGRDVNWIQEEAGRGCLWGFFLLVLGGGGGGGHPADDGGVEPGGLVSGGRSAPGQPAAAVAGGSRPEANQRTQAEAMRC
jgi:hypothetical protein